MSSGERKNSKADSFRSRLETACDGLVLISETDSGVEPVFGRKASGRSHGEVLSAIGVSVDAKVEIVDADSFFDRVSTPREWFNSKQRENADRFGALKRLLELDLDDLKVYRIGRTRITVFVLGFQNDERVAGVKMEAIET